MKTNNLPFHEWCIIVLFCAILLGLAGFALGRQRNILTLNNNDIEQDIKLLQITIHGQVAHPGVYEMPLKATIKDVLEKSEPLSSADLSQIKIWRKLRDKQIIHISERQWIEIEIAGAVVNGKMKVLSGTRCYELESQLRFLPTADRARFRKRKKFLHNGEIVVIASKKAKGKKNSSNIS